MTDDEVTAEGRHNMCEIIWATYQRSKFTVTYMRPIWLHKGKINKADLLLEQLHGNLPIKF